MRDDESTWRKQADGIGQGSPLSPYFFRLFTIVIMAALFSDIHRALDGIFFSQVLYADFFEQIHKATRIDIQLKKWNTWGVNLNYDTCINWVPIKGSLMLRKLGRPSWSSLCFSRHVGGGVRANNWFCHRKGWGGLVKKSIFFLGWGGGAKASSSSSSSSSSS